MNRTLTGLTIATFALAGLLSVGLLDAVADDHGDAQDTPKAGCNRAGRTCGNANKPKGRCDKAKAGCNMQKGTCCTKDGSCGEKPAKAVETAIAELDAAEAALKAGDTEKAHAAIQSARKRLAAAHGNMARRHNAKAGSCDRAAKGGCDKAKKANCDGTQKRACDKPKEQASRPAVINTRCPMMGNAIDPAKVPANLYREYQGKGVGFCCGGCPAQWDKLSDEQKQAKLSAVSG
jgi:hypothetical protein